MALGRFALFLIFYIQVSWIDLGQPKLILC